MSDAENPPIIEVRDLVRRLGGTDVLDGVSFSVQTGEIVGVEGPSGAGKSTLLHLIAALDKPDAGTITVAGIDVVHVHSLTHYRRSQIGLIFQLHNLVPRLTAEQNVALAMFGTHAGRAQRRQRPRELLEQVGLASKATARPPTMSGGERQRVAIARALANRPPVLLADEPTGSLDDESAASIIDLFSTLRNDTGVTLLVVSHDPRLNERTDRLLRLEHGKVHPVAPAAVDG